MNKMIVFASLTLLLTQCKLEPGISKIPEGEEDGYVFYKGIRRFLSDRTELDPLIQSIMIDDEDILLDFSPRDGLNSIALRRDQDYIDCYVKPENGKGVYSFSYCFPTGKTTDARLVPGMRSLPDFSLPGTRDYWCSFDAEESHYRGVLRDGVYYASDDSEKTVFVSERGAYELVCQQELVDEMERFVLYLAYRPFVLVDGSPAFGDRVFLMKNEVARFVNLGLSSPDRYFYTEGDDPRWYRFSEENLELEDLGPYEGDRYRFLDLYYEDQPNPASASWKPLSTRYFVEEGDRTYLKDLANSSFLLDVTDRVARVEDVVRAGCIEDLGWIFYANSATKTGDGYLESENRWTGADLILYTSLANKHMVKWEITIPYLKTNRYDFRLHIDNDKPYIPLPTPDIYWHLIRSDAGKEDYGYTNVKSYSVHPFDADAIEIPFLYDYVDTKGDEILEVGPSLSPLMNPPLATL